MMKRIIFYFSVVLLSACSKSPEEQAQKLKQNQLENAAELKRAKADSLELEAKKLKKEVDSVNDAAQKLEDSAKKIGK